MPAELPSFVGRVITGLEQDEYDNFLLRLDDGTALEFDPRGDREYDRPTVVHLTPELVRERERAAEAARRAAERDLARLHKAQERKRRDIAQKRKQLDPAAFERWRRDTYPTTGEMLRDVWTDSKIMEQFKGSPTFSGLGK